MIDPSNQYKEHSTFSTDQREARNCDTTHNERSSKQQLLHIVLVIGEEEEANGCVSLATAHTKNKPNQTKPKQ
jgi:hypothetical protein